MKVREAVADDAEAVRAIHVRARSVYYRGFLDEDTLEAENRREVADYVRMIGSAERTTWCAVVSGRVVGFLVVGQPFHPDPDPAVGSELYQVQVDPEHFRLGVGTRLHEAALGFWRGSTTRVARLWAWEFNEGARAFYTRLGWEHDGHRRPDDPRIGRYRMLGFRLVIAD